ncbi:MAG: hypothetical protein AB7E73_16935, partial [Burkholderiales bacterium]
MGRLSNKPSVFVEPFAGGAIASLTVAAEGLADHVYMAELDDDVSSVWKTILPLLNFEWVKVRDGAGSPMPGVKGGLRGYRSPAKRTLDAWNRV